MYESKAHFANLYQNTPSTFTFSNQSDLKGKAFAEWQAQFRSSLHTLLGLDNMYADLNHFLEKDKLINMEYQI